RGATLARCWRRCSSWDRRSTSCASWMSVACRSKQAEGGNKAMHTQTAAARALPAEQTPARKWGRAEGLALLWVGAALLGMFPVCALLQGAFPVFTILWLIVPLLTVLVTRDAR